MAESKQYKDLTPKEKYDSAIEADKAPWDPIQTAKDLIVEKLSPKKEEAKRSWSERHIFRCS